MALPGFFVNPPIVPAAAHQKPGICPGLDLRLLSQSADRANSNLSEAGELKEVGDLPSLLPANDTFFTEFIATTGSEPYRNTRFNFAITVATAG